MAKISAKEREETRQRILLASRTVFRANGFEKTSIKGIAEEAGIGTSTLYGYYSSKMELFVSAFIHLYNIDRLDENKILSALENGISKALSDLLILTRQELVVRDKELVKHFYLMSLADNRENIRCKKQEYHRNEFEYVKKVLEIFERTNIRLCAFSLNHLADCILTLVEQVGIELMILGETSLEEAEVILIDQLRVLFAGKYENI